MNLVLFVFVSIFCHVYATLRCFDCDPLSEGKCEDPLNNNIKSTICKSENEYSMKDPQLEFSCYTLLRTGDNSGTYRGCEVGTSETVCETLKTKVPELKSCKPCSGDNCNSEDFPTEKDDNNNGDNGDNGGNGDNVVADTATSMGILTMGVIFVICAS